MAEPTDRPGALIADLTAQALAGEGYMMTGMVGLVTFLDTDGAQMYAVVLGEQTLVVTQGMADILDKTVDDLVRKNFNLAGE